MSTSMPTNGATRRGLLRELARQIVPAIHDLGSEPSTADRPADLGRPAGPPTRTASLDELTALADTLGLRARRADIARLAAGTGRLTPTPEASPASWSVTDAEAVLHIDLAQMSSALGGMPSPLPARGTLRVTIVAPLAGPAPVSLTCVARHAEAAPEPSPSSASRLALTGELVLPRAWSAAVEALDLSEDERNAWIKLRRALAAAQGTVLPDEDPDGAAVHRVLGYADERTGLLPEACDGRRPPTDADRTVPAAERWRLLMQLSSGGGIVWPWGDERSRLYVWLHRGELDSAVALLQ